MAGSDESKHIVILGAGFGGLSTALSLARLQRQLPALRSYRIILIDRNNFQLFTPDLYEIAAASRQIQKDDELKDIVCVNVPVALGKRAVGYIRAHVTDIDRTKKVVQTSKGEVAYDFLVIALGSEPTTFGIDGMEKFAMNFKTIDDAIAIRTAIYDQMDHSPQTRVLVCGAGPAGVELAAELRTACRKKHGKQCFQIVLVEGRSNVLPMFRPPVQETAARRLRAVGIAIKTDFVIAKVAQGKLTAKTEETLTGDIIIWVGGVRAHSVLQTTALSLTPRGQVAVAESLQSREDAHIFVIGDCAQVPAGRAYRNAAIDTEYCPQTAHEAVHQAPVVAENIARMVQGKSLRTYRAKSAGFVIALGGKQGMVILPSGIIFTGVIAWILRKLIDFRHFREVLPFMRACSVWIRGLRVMITND